MSDAEQNGTDEPHKRNQPDSNVVESETSPESPSTSHQPHDGEIASKRKITKKTRKRQNNGYSSNDPQPLENVESEYGYPLELGGADILPHGDVDGQEQSAPNAVSVSQQNIGADASISQPTDKVYIQETSGFRRTEREQYEKYLNERQKLELGKESTLVSTNIEAIQTGITCQNFFRTFALILQGLTAGFSIAHCLLVLFLSPPYFKNVDFIDHYAPLAMPLHCLYYVVLVVDTVAVLDRYDVRQTFFRVVWRAITFQSGGLSVLLYITIVAINAVCLPVEERINLFRHNATSLYGSTNELIQATESPDVAYDLNYWRGLLIARAVLAFLGWFLVALRPTTDLLSKHMRNAGDEFSGNTKPIESVSATVIAPIPL